MTGDSAADVLAKCKVLFPAGRYQTGDSDAVKAQNMRQALAGVQFTPAGLAAKSTMLGDARPEELKGDAMAMAFNGLYAVISAKADAEKRRPCAMWLATVWPRPSKRNARAAPRPAAR